MSDALGFGRRRLIKTIVESNWKNIKPEEKAYSFNELLFVIQELFTEEGKQYFDPKKDNRGYNVFRHFVKHVLYRNLANYDSMVLLTSDKGCITGDALLEMPRDLIKYPKGIPLKELEGKGEIYVYCFNVKSQKIELKKCDGVEFVKEDDVWEIILTNGMKIQATQDHPFLQKNGKFKELKDLIYNKNHPQYQKKSKGKKYFTDRLNIIKLKNKKYDYNNIIKNIKNDSQDNNFIKFLISIVCDATITEKTIRFHFSKDRKIKYIRKLLFSLNYKWKEYSYDKKSIIFCLNNKKLIKKILTYIPNKELSNSFLNYNINQKILILETYAFFDGCKLNDTYSVKISTSSKINKQILELLLKDFNIKNKWKYSNGEKTSYLNKKHYFISFSFNNIYNEKSRPVIYQNGGIIKNIIYKGKQRVLDVVNVRDNHNFIVNGFIVSNTGKSSAAIMLAREWCRYIGIKFNPSRHIAYTNADVMNKIDALRKFEPLVCDESINFCTSAEWAKKENKELKKKLAQVRTKHLLFILCFPLKINKIEKNYLDSFVNYWCLTGDTKIVTKDKTGMIRNTPIKKLNKFNPEVLTYNIKSKKYEFKKYEKRIKTKELAEIYELELENGLKIKCTNEHPFLTQRGWIRLKDLSKDDKIEVNERYCKYCKKAFIPNKQQHFLCTKKCSDAFNVRTERHHKYNKKYRIENAEKIKQTRKNKYKKNREEMLKKAKLYREKNKKQINLLAAKYREDNKELLRERDKKYREKNYDHQLKLKRENWRKYRSTNINFKIRENLRNALRRILKQHQTKKTHPIFEYLGCSIKEFKEHISKQFKLGMSWENWNKNTWHIDHIVPCSNFDLSKESERYICFNYKNQQPLWAVDNMSKGDRYVG